MSRGLSSALRCSTDFIDYLCEARRFAYLTLPDGQYLPAVRLKRFALTLIAEPIAFEFWTPELEAAFGHSSQFACWVRVLMPHATMHKDRDLPPRKNYVRAGVSNT